MKVDAQELWQAVKNASLFTKAKTWNGGEAQFFVRFLEDGQGVLRVTASDDFVTVVTEIPIEGPRQASHSFFGYLPAKELKALESELREQSGNTDFTLAGMKADPAEEEWWKGLATVYQEVFLPTSDNAATVSTWELNPERLTLLSRLEPKGEYPLSWRAVMVSATDREEEGWLWGFKYGPRTHGLIVPLERDALEEELEDAADVLW